MLTVQCPKCGQTLRLLERHLGVKGKCLKCAEPIIAERDGDRDEVVVLLLTEYQKKPAVVTPIESARSEWTPFELAANESGTIPDMNTNDPFSNPPVSPFGEPGARDPKVQPEASMSGDAEPEESGESKSPEPESKPAIPGPLGGFSSALFSKPGPAPAAAAEDADTDSDVDSASASDSDIEAEAEAEDARAESSVEGETSSPPMSQAKAAMPPLPGIAGMAGFPLAGKSENKTGEPSAEDSGDEVPGPQFSNAIDPGEASPGNDSKALPWMDLLAGKADSESGKPAADDAAADAVDASAEIAEPTGTAVDDQKTAEADTLDEVKAEAKAEPKAETEDVSASGDDVDGESRSKLNWAAGLKAKTNQGASFGATGAGAKVESNIEVNPIQSAEPKVAGDDAVAPPAATEAPAESPAPVEGDAATSPNSAVPGEQAVPPAAAAVTKEPAPAKAVDSKVDAGEAPAPKTKSKSAIEGADPSVTSTPMVNKVRERRNRRKARRLIAALLLFLIIPAAGIAGLMYFKPAFRPKQLQPAVMAAYSEGRDQFSDSEKGFDFQAIIAPITALWTQQGPVSRPEENGAADVAAADEGRAPGSTEGKPVAAAAAAAAGGKPLLAEVVPSVGNASSESVAGGTDGPVDKPGAVDVAVATSPGPGPAADVDAVVDGGASPADEVGLTRAGPGEDDETRRVRTEGEAILKQFYAARSAEGKLAYVLDPGSVAAAIEDAFPSPVEIPSIRSMTFKGRLVDSSTKRVFGVFDVRENENGDRHRWCVPEIAPDQFKVDWELYQQLVDDELTRFLATPGADPETFRLLIRRGPVMAEAERPWNEETLEMHLLMPLDDGKPSRVLIPRSRHNELGFDGGLADGAARVAKVELGWKETATDPGIKVPTITAIERWGAWE